MYRLLLFLFIPLISARPPVTVVELDKYYNILYTCNESIYKIMI